MTTTANVTRFESLSVLEATAGQTIQSLVDESLAYAKESGLPVLCTHNGSVAVAYQWNDANTILASLDMSMRSRRAFAERARLKSIANDISSAFVLNREDRDEVVFDILMNNFGRKDGA